MGREIDYEAVFGAGPSPMVLLSTDLVILAVNDAYVKVSGRDRQWLIGQDIFAAFPDNPHDPQGARALRASLERVLTTGERDVMALQRYDVQVPDRPEVLEARYWSPVNTPVFDADGKIELIAHRVEEVTGFLQELRHTHVGEGSAEVEAIEAEVFARGRELAQANERLSAMADVFTALLSGEASEQVLELIASAARRISGARSAVIMVSDSRGPGLVTAAAVAAGAELPAALGERARQVHRTGRSMTIGGTAGDGPAMLVPLGETDSIRGVLVLSNPPGGEDFPSVGGYAVEPFAAQAAIALELAERRRDAARLLILEDRDRIGRDLHASVIDRLFTTSMELAATAKIAVKPQVADRIRESINVLDEVIGQIRAAVFELGTASPGGPDLRSRIRQVIDAAARQLGTVPTVRLENRLEESVDEQAADHLLAMLRDTFSSRALAGTPPQGAAGQLTVTVEAGTRPGRLLARIETDTDQLTAPAGLSEHARRLGGSLTLTPRPGGGTIMVWQLPLRA